jgi:hypothetical protein
MRLAIPHDLKHSSFRLTVRVVGGWSTSSEFDDSFKFVDVDLPADVSESTVEAFIEPLLANGEVDESAVKQVLIVPKRPKRGKPGGTNSRNNGGK